SSRRGDSRIYPAPHGFSGNRRKAAVAGTLSPTFNKHASYRQKPGRLWPGWKLSLSFFIIHLKQLWLYSKTEAGRDNFFVPGKR
ncbi:MAG TPA: hypothetical protein PKY23_07740, partial [Bacillota bacterium]|nr:hypothetical protein [Bacillota bacterium]